MGLFTKSTPKIRQNISRKESFTGWQKCAGCTELVHEKELQETIQCCPKCGFHFRLPLEERISLLADRGSFEELFTDIVPTDPLEFEDVQAYSSRLQKASQKTGRDDAISTGICTLDGRRLALGVMDFSFLGGSMGSVVGERLALLIEKATFENLPLILVSSSGGARMQESVLSLMQMAKTSAALAKHSEAGLAYISVLTHPTTGGVTASFATLGDLIVAEPKALIAFAGPRVVEQTIGQKLPKGAQKSEFLLDNGMIDCIIERKDLKPKLSLLLEYLAGNTLAKNGQKRLKELLEKQHEKK